ncbi:hypothetical protein PPACK8108_LOCUS11304 [Phakopsora pachyrhizi]|uniref:Uncharacterized protein n=1 Tax=Phakopsora pachyrhizi TaxID=170000 RepID=A0AAV0B4Y5_PHAPC|nr:hypothetical protein PPACK8108_LOCUS11304 [Phakopsora pachyrhizi]
MSPSFLPDGAPVGEFPKCWGRDAPLPLSNFSQAALLENPSLGLVNSARLLPHESTSTGDRLGKSKSLPNLRLENFPDEFRREPITEDGNPKTDNDGTKYDPSLYDKWGIAHEGDNDKAKVHEPLQGESSSKSRLSHSSQSYHPINLLPPHENPYQSPSYKSYYQSIIAPENNQGAQNFPSFTYPLGSEEFTESPRRYFRQLLPLAIYPTIYVNMPLQRKEIQGHYSGYNPRYNMDAPLKQPASQYHQIHSYPYKATNSQPPEYQGTSSSATTPYQSVAEKSRKFKDGVNRKDSPQINNKNKNEDTDASSSSSQNPSKVSSDSKTDHRYLNDLNDIPFKNEEKPTLTEEELKNHIKNSKEFVATNDPVSEEDLNENSKRIPIAKNSNYALDNRKGSEIVEFHKVDIGKLNSAVKPYNDSELERPYRRIESGKSDNYEKPEAISSSLKNNHVLDKTDELIINDDNLKKHIDDSQRYEASKSVIDHNLEKSLILKEILGIKDRHVPNKDEDLLKTGKTIINQSEGKTQKDTLSSSIYSQRDDFEKVDSSQSKKSLNENIQESNKDLSHYQTQQTKEESDTTELKKSEVLGKLEQNIKPLSDPSSFQNDKKYEKELRDLEIIHENDEKIGNNLSKHAKSEKTRSDEKNFIHKGRIIKSVEKSIQKEVDTKALQGNLRVQKDYKISKNKLKPQKDIDEPINPLNAVKTENHNSRPSENIGGKQAIEEKMDSSTKVKPKESLVNKKFITQSKSIIPVLHDTDKEGDSVTVKHDQILSREEKELFKMSNPSENEKRKEFVDQESQKRLLSSDSKEISTKDLRDLSQFSDDITEPSLNYQLNKNLKSFKKLSRNNEQEILRKKIKKQFFDSHVFSSKAQETWNSWKLKKMDPRMMFNMGIILKFDQPSQIHTAIDHQITHEIRLLSDVLTRNKPEYEKAESWYISNMAPFEGQRRILALRNHIRHYRTVERCMSLVQIYPKDRSSKENEILSLDEKFSIISGESGILLSDNFFAKGEGPDPMPKIIKESFGNEEAANRRVEFLKYAKYRNNPAKWWKSKKDFKLLDIKYGVDYLRALKVADILQFGWYTLMDIDCWGRMTAEDSFFGLMDLMKSYEKNLPWNESPERYWLMSYEKEKYLTKLVQISNMVSQRQDLIKQKLLENPVRRKDFEKIFKGSLNEIDKTRLGELIIWWDLGYKPQKFFEMKKVLENIGLGLMSKNIPQRTDSQKSWKTDG